MAVSSTPVPAAPQGLTAKGLRAWAFLGEHEKRVAERRGGLRDYYCGPCGSYLFSYVPPIGLFTERCHECGERFTFTTEQR